jgi:crossover junction endodeoxyribonuclease RusA
VTDVERRRIVSFAIPGEPKAKERPRHGKGGRTFTPAATLNAEKGVAQLFVAACQLDEPLACDVAIRMDFLLVRRGRRDVDNLQKLVMDALNGVAYVDDNQVVDVRATKRFVEKGQAASLITLWAVVAPEQQVA